MNSNIINTETTFSCDDYFYCSFGPQCKLQAYHCKEYLVDHTYYPQKFCKFFQQGNCSKGDKCTFIHIKGTEICGKINCNCKKLHNLPYINEDEENLAILDKYLDNHNDIDFDIYSNECDSDNNDEIIEDGYYWLQNVSGLSDYDILNGQIINELAEKYFNKQISFKNLCNKLQAIENIHQHIWANVNLYNELVEKGVTFSNDNELSNVSPKLTPVPPKPKKFVKTVQLEVAPVPPPKPKKFVEAFQF